VSKYYESDSNDVNRYLNNPFMTILGIVISILLLPITFLTIAIALVAKVFGIFWRT
jgi:hypothetical protein